MSLTLSDISRNPEDFSEEIRLGFDLSVVLRPLVHADQDSLASFFSKLKPETWEVCRYGESAAEMCAAIGCYDKLRFVLAQSNSIIGLFEYSFEITDGDVVRFENYGFHLNRETDCGFAPCLADEHQNRGIGSAVFPRFSELARRFGQRRIILLGGVFRSNVRAIRFYRKCGFRQVGQFCTSSGKESLDMILEIDAQVTAQLGVLRCDESGLVMDGTVEPVFEPQQEREVGKSKFREIPRAFVARIRSGIKTATGR